MNEMDMMFKSILRCYQTKYDSDDDTITSHAIEDLIIRLEARENDEET